MADRATPLKITTARLQPWEAIRKCAAGSINICPMEAPAIRTPTARLTRCSPTIRPMAPITTTLDTADAPSPIITPVVR